MRSFIESSLRITYSQVICNYITFSLNLYQLFHSTYSHIIPFLHQGLAQGKEGQGPKSFQYWLIINEKCHKQRCLQSNSTMYYYIKANMYISIWDLFKPNLVASCWLLLKKKRMFPWQQFVIDTALWLNAPGWICSNTAGQFFFLAWCILVIYTCKCICAPVGTVLSLIQGKRVYHTTM